MRKLAKAVLLFPVIVFLLSGCTGSLEEGLPGSDDQTVTYHSKGWKDNPQHGHQYSTNPQYCKACHGEDLTGGSSGVSCVSCHHGWDPGGMEPGPNCFTPGCHVESQSHTTHFDAQGKGPGILKDETGCSTCHEEIVMEIKDSACNICHSPLGAFNGVEMGVADWDSGAYDTDGNLREGADNWCLSCHDDNPYTPENESALIDGVYAPNIAGDENNGDTYGFNLTGHKINCLSCHDSSGDHIDGEPRTYFSASSPSNYQAGYRLRSVDDGEPMKLPRAGHDPLFHNDFALCADCHNVDEVIGETWFDKSYTNFKDDDDSKDRNYHYYHLDASNITFDSDWDGVVDSYGSCTACHTVHGPSNQAMIRDGSLINKEPGLNFCYLTSPDLGSCDTTESLQNSVGSLIDPNGSNFSQNGMCGMGCHSAPVGPGSEDLFRVPYLGPKVIGPKAEPETIFKGEQTDVLLTAFILDHSIPSDISSVTVDLDAIGGLEEDMYDDGDNVIDGSGTDSGDEVAGDGTYSHLTTVPDTLDSGEYDLLVTATDSYSDSGEGTIELSVMVSGRIIVDDPDATFVPDCTTPGSCDPYSQWAYYSGGTPYGPGLRYMAIKSETTGGTIDGTATWTPNIIDPGLYHVYAWWNTDMYRSPSVKYTIYYNDGTDSVEVPANQLTGGGQWNYLVTRNFNAGMSCYVELSNDAPPGTQVNTYVIADAIKFEPVGDTYTLSGQISTLDGVTVYLTGAMKDSTVTAGGGNYSFTVTDGNYTVTPSLAAYEFSPTSQDVEVSGGPETADFVTNWTGVVDNPDATFVPDCPVPGYCDPYSQWDYYTGGTPYGPDLRYMAIKSETTGGTIDGTATWTPSIPSTGQYNVYAWWNTDFYRSPSVKYTIYYNDGTDSVEVTVNQLTAGGQWNYLDTRNFNAGMSCYVEMSNDAPTGGQTNTYVIADAIWWEPVP